jgi:FeS assembly SUF system protein
MIQDAIMANESSADDTIADEAAVSDVVTGEGSSLPAEELEALGKELIAAIKTVYDPEIPVDIFELGLIYKVDVADNKDIAVDMTLTAPGCPVAGEMPIMVKDALATVPGIGEITVNMVFDPPWTPERMSEEAKLELNMY